LVKRLVYGKIQDVLLVEPATALFPSQLQYPIGEEAEYGKNE